MKKLNLIVIMLIFAWSTFAQTTTKNHSATETTTVSTTNNDQDYLLTATFSTRTKQDELAALITKVLGNANLKTDIQSSWKMVDTYSLILKPGKLTIELDKEKASAGLISNFVQLGKGVEKTLSGATPKQPTTPN